MIPLPTSENQKKRKASPKSGNVKKKRRVSGSPINQQKLTAFFQQPSKSSPQKQQEQSQTSSQNSPTSILVEKRPIKGASPLKKTIDTDNLSDDQVIGKICPLFLTDKQKKLKNEKEKLEELRKENEQHENLRDAILEPIPDAAKRQCFWKPGEAGSKPQETISDKSKNQMTKKVKVAEKIWTSNVSAAHVGWVSSPDNNDFDLESLKFSFEKGYFSESSQTILTTPEQNEKQKIEVLNEENNENLSQDLFAGMKTTGNFPKLTEKVSFRAILALKQEILSKITPKSEISEKTIATNQIEKYKRTKLNEKVIEFVQSYLSCVNFSEKDKKPERVLKMVHFLLSKMTENSSKLPEIVKNSFQDGSITEQDEDVTFLTEMASQTNNFPSNNQNNSLIEATKASRAAQFAKKSSKPWIDELQELDNLNFIHHPRKFENFRSWLEGFSTIASNKPEKTEKMEEKKKSPAKKSKKQDTLDFFVQKREKFSPSKPSLPNYSLPEGDLDWKSVSFDEDAGCFLPSTPEELGIREEQVIQIGKPKMPMETPNLSATTVFFEKDVFKPPQNKKKDIDDMDLDEYDAFREENSMLYGSDDEDDSKSKKKSKTPKKKPNPPKNKKKEIPKSKIFMIKGNTGTGKSDFVFALAKELNFDVMEINSWSNGLGIDAEDENSNNSSAIQFSQTTSNEFSLKEASPSTPLPSQKKSNSSNQIFDLLSDTNTNGDVKKLLWKKDQRLVLIDEIDLIVKLEKQAFSQRNSSNSSKFRSNLMKNITNLMRDRKSPIVFTCETENFISDLALPTRCKTIFKNLEQTVFESMTHFLMFPDDKFHSFWINKQFWNLQNNTQLFSAFPSANFGQITFYPFLEKTCLFLFCLNLRKTNLLMPIDEILELATHTNNNIKFLTNFLEWEQKNSKNLTIFAADSGEFEEHQTILDAKNMFLTEKYFGIERISKFLGLFLENRENFNSDVLKNKELFENCFDQLVDQLEISKKFNLNILFNNYLQFDAKNPKKKQKMREIAKFSSALSYTDKFSRYSDSELIEIQNSIENSFEILAFKEYSLSKSTKFENPASFPASRYCQKLKSSKIVIESEILKKIRDYAHKRIKMLFIANGLFKFPNSSLLPEYFEIFNFVKSVLRFEKVREDNNTRRRFSHYFLNEFQPEERSFIEKCELHFL